MIITHIIDDKEVKIICVPQSSLTCRARVGFVKDSDIEVRHSSATIVIIPFFCTPI